jgi:hypothetical protein
MDRYSHVYRGDLGKALNALPNLFAPIRQTAAATGTDGKSVPNRLSPDLSPGGEAGKSLMQSGAVNPEATASSRNEENSRGNESFSGKNGEAGIRTRDTGLTPYNGLANRRLQPLGHLSRMGQKVVRKTAKRK